jgi:threonine/homoserine/homoserine lactone efflux protein
MDAWIMLSYLGAAVVLTVMPGPDNLFVLAQSIVTGARAGIATSLGLCTGLLVHIAAATLGISAVIYQSALAFALVKYAGAAYLLYLAYRSFRDKSSIIQLGSERSYSSMALYRRGIVMNVLNPKVSLFFLAFLPQFVRHESGGVTYQMLVYGVIFIIQAFVIFSLISLFAARIGRHLNQHPSLARRMNLIQGSLFSLIGLKIAFGSD